MDQAPTRRRVQLLSAASSHLKCPQRGRAAWVLAAVALLLAAGAWMLGRVTKAPTLTVGTPAASAPRVLEPPRNEAKVETAATLASTAASAGRPPLPTPAIWPADQQQKVELALQGGASPQEALEAADVLQRCQGAEGAVATLYRLRDEASPEWRQLKMAGYGSDEFIARTQDFQRRCQVFGSATLARRGELLKRAYEGGARDSALPYLQWINSEGRQKFDPELVGKLQREARRMPDEGDFFALTEYAHAFDPAALGVTPAQRQGYKEAWLRIQGEMSGPEGEKVSRASMESLERTMSKWEGPPKALSVEQQREADALTERVVEAWRRRWSRDH